MRQWLMALELLMGSGVFADVAISAPIVAYRVVDDGIPLPLTEQLGDVARGRDIAANRQVGMCPLCHQAPSNADRFQGDIATSLVGAGSRWTLPQLRLRMVDSRRVNADSVMPSYYKVNGLTRVGTKWRNTPILDAQQVEDVVAWLASLK